MIESQINENLWKSIQKNYESRNFSESIIDAIYFLSNMIRDKTGLESDGVPLIGQAFGGANPLIKVNSLQTESELNVQKGLEQILRGIFQAIRNPRSHDRYEDSQKDADAIIIFIDYISRIIDHSKTQFSEIDFLNRIFDSNYVVNDRYSELIVEDIPKRKRLNFSIEVYKKKETGDGKKLASFFKAVIKQFSDDELKQFLNIVSEELTIVSDEKSIRYNLQVVPSDYWKNIREVARIRIENLLMQSIKEGRYLVDSDRCNGGSLGTWLAWGTIKNMTFLKDFLGIFLRKLNSKDRTESDYILKYFWNDLVNNIAHPNQYFNRIIKEKLQEGDIRFYSKLDEHFIFIDENDILLKTFKEDFEQFVEKPDDQLVISDDDLPF